MPTRSSFREAFPALAAEWHPTLNKPITVLEISPGSSKKYWWLGTCGHSWQASPGHRVAGRGCPVCAGKSILLGHNDLATTRPDLAAEWHPTKNVPLAPHAVTKGSGRRVWWVDSLGHEWQAQIINRDNGTNCPICSGNQVLAGFNDLKTRFPRLATEWHPSKNALGPTHVSAYSGGKAWWVCTEGHEWEATIANRANGNGCPICAGQMVLTGLNDMATTNPELAAEWHPTRNGGLTPAMVFAGLGRKVWWRDLLGHEWETTGNSRVSGVGCPICAGQRILVGFNDLATRMPALAAEWHPSLNGPRSAESVTVMNGKKAWWLGVCGHEWEAVVSSRSAGTGCPICAGQKVFEGFNDLVSRRPEIAAQWHPTLNEDRSPSHFAEFSNKKAWWNCPEGHSWESTISNRTHGQGCPMCAEHGFNPGKPGYLYFLQHDGFNALKIGITNVGTTRLEAFQQRGWNVLNLELFERGGDAAAIETVIKRWWRRDLGLPIWLGQLEMAQTGGWSETICRDLLESEIVVERIKTERHRVSGRS